MRVHDAFFDCCARGLLRCGTASDLVLKRESGGVWYVKLRKVGGLVADLAAASAADECGPLPYIAGIYNYNV
jgi:hypothetical protein